MTKEIALLQNVDEVELMSMKGMLDGDAVHLENVLEEGKVVVQTDIQLQQIEIKTDDQVQTFHLRDWPREIFCYCS